MRLNAIFGIAEFISVQSRGPELEKVLNDID